MPFLFAGLSVASVLAILGAVVGEFVGAKSGLGMLLMQYDQQMELAPLFAVILLLALIGFLIITRSACWSAVIAFGRNARTRHEHEKLPHSLAEIRQ